MPAPPPSFHGFCGQRKIVETLKTHIDGALRNARCLPHTALIGESGMGKTQLANAVAKALGTDLHSYYCSPQTKRSDLSELLSRIGGKGDIVFLDEVHALKPPVQEMLYPAIDRLQVPAVMDNKIIDNEWLDIPEWTMIIASDRPGELRNALRQRIILTLQLSTYDDKEMRVIVQNRASEMGLLLSTQAVTRLAQAARGIPRKVRHLLESLHCCVEDENSDITKGEVRKHLESLGIDKDNLNAQDRLYLSALARQAGTMSLHSIALATGLDEEAVRRNIEPYLITRGWVDIQSKGRALTFRGREFTMKRRMAE